MILILLPGDIGRLAGPEKANVLGKVGYLAIIAIVVPLISGALSDRCKRKEGRRKPYIAVGVVLNIIGLMLMAYSVVSLKSWVAYLASYGVVQFGNNIASGAYMGIIPDVVRKDEHGKASGFMALMSQFGTLIGIIIIGIVLKSDQTFLRYGTIGFLLAISGAMSYFGIKENQLKVDLEPFKVGQYIKSLWIDPRKYPNFAWVWITRFLVMLGFYSIVPYINFYLMDVVQIPSTNVEAKASILFALILIVSSLTGIYGGLLSDKIGRKGVVYVANAVMAVIAPAFIICHNFYAALIVGAIFGLGYGAYLSVDYALGTDVLPHKEEAGKDMAIWHVAMTLPQSIGQPLASRLLTISGYTLEKSHVIGEKDIVHYSTTGYGYIFVFCTVCLALGAYLLRNLKGIK
jgi:MFS family permease